MKYIALLLVSFFAACHCVADFIPAGGGSSPAVLVVPATQAKLLMPPAEQFRKYVKRITGTELPIGSAASGKRVEFVLSGEMDKESFSITFPEKEVMRLTGGSPTALEFAVFELLERYAGCRWLLPGPVGEVIPRAEKIAIPEKPIAQSPRYKTRCIGIRWTKWEEKYCNLWFNQIRRSGLPVRFSHNVHRLFDPGIFYREHPEFYPLYNGKRFNPLTDRGRWQPCFTAPGLAEAAAQRIVEHFRKTGARTYALGVHDTSAYCECDRCLKMDSRRINVCHYPDRSASYFHFCNKAAELVTKKFPDAKLGFLAYENLMEPPAGKVHPALVPFITYDRMQWLIPEKKKQDQALTLAWKAKGVKEIGWYDYCYGRHYQLPRLYLRQMQEYLKWGARNGVRHFYCEFGPAPDWHEGPKFYMLAKLLWNPDMDLEAALDDWYLKAVGPKAAPYLKEYFELMEKYWTARAVKSPFFRVNYTYLDFNSNAYLDYYTSADIDRSAALLAKVAELADSKERAEFFRRSFAAREKGLRTYVRNRELARNCGKYDFDTVLLKNDFSRDIPGSWQGGKGKFFHAKTEGVNGTPAAGMDFNGSNRQGMVYLVFPDDRGKEFFKAEVKYKIEGIDPQGKLHPGHFEAAKVNLSIRWQGSVTSDPNSPKIDWLPGICNVYAHGEVIPDGKWRTMTVYARRPLLPAKRMVVALGASRCSKGKVLFDDLEVRAADGR